MPAIQDRLGELASYISTQSGGVVQGFPKDIEFGLEIGASDKPLDGLIDGMTTLCRACCDIASLFRIASMAQAGKTVLEKHIIGLLFEVHLDVDEWIWNNIRVLYQQAAKDISEIAQLRSALHREYEQHKSAMKEIRNSVFHKEQWYSDDVIDFTVKVIYGKKIPGLLHKKLAIYGADIAGALLKDGIGIPGIGCFGVLPIPGAPRANFHFDNPYWP